MDKIHFFDKLAAEWELQHAVVDESAEIAGLIEAFSLREGDAVLDAGCGTGRILPGLKSAVGPRGRVVEFDFSLGMLVLGKLKTDPKEAAFLQGDAHSLPLRAGSFDAVVCFSLFPHLDRPVEAVSEFSRVLVPGRRLFVAHLMSCAELNRMHGSTSGPVKHDMLPDSGAMTRIFERVGLVTIRIVDRPGFYLAEAMKPSP